MAEEAPKYCGVGPTAILPNDPDVNTGSIHVFGVRFGIGVNWTYPADFPEMIGFSTVYRSTTSDFSGAQRLARVSADNYTDVLDESQKGTRYFYWVIHTSLHGTVGNPIGPDSAIWRGSIDNILDDLNNLIDQSKLDEHLRNEISRITDLTSGLSEEEQARLGLGSVLNDAIAILTADLEAVDTVVGNAIIEMTDDRQALAAQVNVLLARFNDSVAAVFDETAAVATASRATALRLTTVESALTDPATGDLYVISVQEQFLTDIRSDLGDVSELNDLGSVSVINPITGEPIVEPTLTDRFADMYGQWSIKIDANGFVSGLGLRSTDDFSEFIVNANVFAIGPPQNHNIVNGDAQGITRPFIVLQEEQADGTFESVIGMNTEVFIRDGTIKNAMIDNVIQSTNWNWNAGNFQGWQINKNGDAYFDNIFARGDIEATSIRADTVDVVNTLMIKDNAVTIPEGVYEDLRDNGGTDITPSWKNLATITMIWGDEAPPRAFIINALYMALGTDRNGNVARAGDGIITVVGEYGWLTGAGDLAAGQEVVNYQAYAVSMPRGYGAMVSGLWHITPPEVVSGRRVEWAHFTLRGKTNLGQDSRQVIDAVMSILGAKR